MGYYTRYTIKRAEGPGDFEAALRESCCLNADHLNGNESLKWYEHDRDIARVMLATGTILVDVHGEGEEQGDVWDKEYRLSGVHVEMTEYRYTLARGATPAEVKRLS